MKLVWQTLKQSLVHLIYPKRCLHCQNLLPPESPLLCDPCASLLELIDPKERCPACFNPLPDEGGMVCQECLHDPSLYARLGAAFDYAGPAASLLKCLKYRNQPYLARGMGGFLAAQWDCLGWPLPDALVPVPLSLTHAWERGYNQSALLAEEMGKIIQRPVWNVLRRRSGDFSQAALGVEERKTLDGSRFWLKTSANLKDKTLLLIDDVLTTGSTLRGCAQCLSEHYPAVLYALTFCRTCDIN